MSEAINRRRRAALEAKLGEAMGVERMPLSLLDHHLCHAGAAYFGRGRSGSGTLILTCDGAGDGACATVSIGRDSRIERIAQIEDAHSIGRLYALVTFLQGMIPLEHEYKIMGMAPYAERDPQSEELANRFASLFRFVDGDPLRWESTIRGGIRAALPQVEAILRRRRFDHVAAGLQLFVERFLCRWVTNCIRETGIGDVVLGGGVFMNVKANKAILALPEVQALYAFPSCGDESNAFGAAYTYLELQAGMRTQPLQHMFLGDTVTGEDVEEALTKGLLDGVPAQIDEIGEAGIDEAIAEALSADGIVARVRGRMEFGARALGNRSILADPTRPQVVRTINAMIKERDFWMPFAPAVLREDFDRYFVRVKDTRMPFMIMACDTVVDTRAEVIGALHPHDFSARPQEVDPDQHQGFGAVLRAFRSLTGRAAVLNTSFNLHGEPIVRTAEEALEVFARSGLPALAVGPFLIRKA